MDSSHAPSPQSTRPSLHCWCRRLCTFTALALTGATGFAASEPSLIDGQKKSYGYTWQQEMKLGAESDKEITEEMGLYDNPALQEYVAAVGQRVLTGSQFNDPKAPEIYRNTKFTFRIIDSPVVNAFALPGGYVYVTRGLLSHVQNEAQLAVVLGHEIAHVAARHSSQQARRSQWGQLGVIAGAILGQKVLGDKMPNIGQNILQGGGQAARMFLLRYSREAEHESDHHGVNYAARVGYAAGDSARFFQSLQRISLAEGKSLPSWQSSHPDPGDRAQRVQQLAAAHPQADNVGEGEYLRHIEGLIVGENPREGFARNGVFYHPELRFQMPVASGWKLDNQKAAVVMAEPNGKALMGLKLAAGARAREAAQQFAQQSKIQVVASGDTQVNGLPATVIIGQGRTEQGTLGVWNAFIEMDGKVYSLLGYAPENAFEQMRPTFESVAAGFSPLRDQSLAAVQPARLKIVRADRSAPFASFVPTSLPPDLNAEEVAIMNQITLNDSVTEGRMIKVPDVAAAPVAAPPMPQVVYPDYRTQGRGNLPQNYPQQPNNYPQTPPTQYPQPSGQPSYPPQNYPPQTYPPQSYPQHPQPSTYPPSYPPQPGYPPAPGPGGYPTNPNQAPAGYPAYPPQPGTYPPTQPPASPQFPQPPSSPNQNRAPNSPSPNWPR